MRWRKHVTAGSLPELEAAAERHFRPGTTYSIFSIREETPAGVFLSYRAEAHPAERPGKDSTSRHTPRGGSEGGTEAGHGAMGVRRSGPSGPDGGPVTGRIIEPSAAGPGILVPGGGSVTAYNPETVDEIPGWRPQEIPARVLRDGPGLNAAFKLLQDSDLDLPPGPAFATDDPEFISLLDRAAPPEGEPVPGAPSGTGDSLIGWNAVARTDASGALHVDHGEPGAVVRTATERADTPWLDAEKPSSTDDESAGRARRSGRPTVVYVGLLDDPIEAAEKCGYRRWSAAGVLNGGQPGANVVCFGLGDGSNITRLTEGLHRYQPMRLILAVDASRKHADTQAWVRQVEKVIQPSSLVSIARTVTSSPATVRELGYPVQYLG